MNRRSLFQMLGAASALPGVPQSVEGMLGFGRDAHQRAALRPSLRVLSPAQASLIGLVADTIIPPTASPGATDVGVVPFVDLLLADWYTADERQQYLTGLADLDTRSRSLHGAAFADLAEAHRLSLLESLDQASGEAGSAEQFFARTKSLTIYGYFTSEPVMKDVLRTQIIPGRFEGCVPLQSAGEE